MKALPNATNPAMPTNATYINPKQEAFEKKTF